MSPIIIPDDPAFLARFWAKVDKSAGPDGCWLWTKGVSGTGHGLTVAGKRVIHAHKLAWLLSGEPWPSRGLHIRHSCRVAICCNRQHMHLGLPGPNPDDPPHVRFWRYVAKTDGCWLWTGGTISTGYGSFAISNRAGHVLAHRFSMQLFLGRDLGDAWVLHRCDNPPCVNPAHLFLGTHADNMADMVIKERTGGQLLTHDQASEIVAAIPTWFRGCGRSFARRFGVSESTVSAIKLRHTWKHL